MWHLTKSDEWFSRKGMNFIYEEFLFYKRWNFERNAALESFRNHNEGVRRYFKSRPKDFFEFDIAATNKWEQLSGFLGVPTTGKQFPFANQRCRES